jgi:hypothetical protein
MKGSATARRRRHPRAQPVGRHGVGRWWITGVVAAAVAVAGGLIILAQARPPTAPVASITEGKVKGNANAPVTVDEWGDFQ